MQPEEELIAILKEDGTDFTASLPCEKFKCLLGMIGEQFFHVPLTREEEGVGICAGAALSGRKPAIFVQSSGVGNMINALLSLTDFYHFPLALFVSQRGVYREKIEAQLPMGTRLRGILEGAAIENSLISTREDFRLVRKNLPEVYAGARIHAFLLSPALWEGSECRSEPPKGAGPDATKKTRHNPPGGHHPPPGFTRFEIISMMAPYLDSRVVVCNLGFPSKELYHIKHQASNFYMLGSMGMATPIGLGIALSSRKEVVVVDGDGSLLMNPGSLATAAYFSPANLTILAIDNGAYGSTGDQPSFTSSSVDLEAVAQGFGIGETRKVATQKELFDAMESPHKGVKFLHILAVPGNTDLPNIPLHHLEIRRQVQDFLGSD
ncbi:MAG TPA: sulfopyruvate decarboxylase subunit alpha [Thermodesulfovibrionales bacterium]|nr:sulfopyruvate decarboxylase subunit alpha [Thermodesulfovibrionales bacterium]